jgi:glycosyltransferase involved in cell wall biosynthesis
VVAVSHTSADDFIRTYTVPAERIVVIPQSVRVPDVIGAAEARRTLATLAPVPHDAPILMHIGSFTPEKNHVWLLRRFRELRGTHPDAHLVLVGDGPLRATVDRVITELGLSNRVHCLGSRTDADTLVAAADILVLPSLVEGLPGVVLEAAACAVPAVASDVGGVSEAIVDGETGILIEIGEPEPFLTAVASLLGDPERCRSLGRRARERAATSFSFELALAEYDRLYEAVIGDGWV